jgi:hypothetical protein
MGNDGVYVSCLTFGYKIRELEYLFNGLIQINNVIVRYLGKNNVAKQTVICSSFYFYLIT